MKKLSWFASILVFALFAIMPGPLPSQEADPDDVSKVAIHMHEHLARITTIKSFIIMGRLDGVREPATWLADHKTAKGLPANFKPYVELMRSDAREIARASDLKSAAKSVTRMARTCGNCHSINEIKLEFGFDTMPADWADTVSLMQRHQWAADRLWEGLIGPSDAAWSRGTNMLVDVPLRPNYATDESLNDEDSDEIDRVAHSVHVLGGHGLNAKTLDARSELFSELLVLCADCHAKLSLSP
jgi:hypothetical protein